jgi:hypothetical protein
VSARRGFAPAVRRGRKARIAVDGPAGSGKTWSALMTARELVGPDGKIGLIDTERNSASLYAEEFGPFESLAWEPPYDPRELAETITAEGGKYDVLIVDSLSHFWRGEGGTLDIVEMNATRNSGGNRFAGWKSGTPAQNAMIDALLLSKCHVIVTMRSATEWTLEKDEKTGKTSPRRHGLAPVQRNDLEFEFDVVADLDLAHTITVSKSRAHPLADRMFPAGHGHKLGQILRGWLESASSEPPAEAAVAEPTPVTVTTAPEANGHVAEPAAADATVAVTETPAMPPARRTAYTKEGAVVALAAAIDDLQGSDRGKFLGKHRLSIVGGSVVASLHVKSMDQLEVMCAELNLGIGEPTAVSVPAAVAGSFDDPDDIPFARSDEDATRSVRLARGVR